MKNLLFILVSLILISFLSSCTAEELPEIEPTINMETVDPNNPEEGVPPVRTVPPIKTP